MKKNKLYFGKQHQHSDSVSKRIELFHLRRQLKDILKELQAGQFISPSMSDVHAVLMSKIIHVALKSNVIFTLRSVVRFYAELEFRQEGSDILLGSYWQTVVLLDPEDREAFDKWTRVPRVRERPIRSFGESEISHRFW